MVEVEPVDWEVFRLPCGGRVDEPKLFICPLDFALLTDIPYLFFISENLSRTSKHNPSRPASNGQKSPPKTKIIITYRK
ncbi:MAG: hypothetical protein UR68_C0002G0034 [Candidatus Roizmanbacteria bacterium GW2011_GWA2_35_19]|uniref:Uncharacterized protein n=2 Tax=Candidatus Roizmaniibacteriota TaxID=1752723 RepID=A0A0G0CCN5_9BACT|nr:MAG: hypothetical protein UR63_C0006G0022 [Candidatus Roizmanbacteria bacterium GW2011_GWC2_35_12]KKP73811.1 MAG: hypothetical protein UR68_C0002G0034 [Candidatus Roizmanbacteria bacterium GW2011_GWA2_35_19]